MREGEAVNINSISQYYNKTRMLGLSGSGFDAETIVEQLMKAERVPLDKLYQKKQLTEWRQEQYREITNTLRSLKDEYFNSLKSASNMLSQSTYKKFTSVCSDSTVLTVTGSADAVAGNHTITVNKIATAAVNTSCCGVTQTITGTNPVNVEGAKGKTFSFQIDGVTKQITIRNDISDEAGLVTAVQEAIDSAFGAGKVAVGSFLDIDAKTHLTFDTVDGSGVNKLMISSGTSESGDALNQLGFTTYASNRLNTGETLENLSSHMSTPLVFDGTGNISLTINGKQFSFSKNTTLSSMMSQINTDSQAGVTIQYDEVNDVFKITAKQTGEGTNINISESGSNFLQAANLKSAVGTGSVSGAYQNYTSGNKAFSVVIDGVSKDIVLDGDYSAFTSSDLETVLKQKIEAAFSGRTITVNIDSDKLSISVDNGTLSVGEPSSGTSALADLGLSAGYKAGRDAEVVLDGQTLTRSSNTFTVAGLTYTLLKESPTEQTVTITQDVDTVFENIKKFVEKYNEVIKTINDKLSEEYDRNYQPLTDEQKEEMSDDEIERWEKKAKTGLLRNDSLLQGIVSEMRRALQDSVSGVELKLSSIGITTGSWEDKGKLVIDEQKLKDAIRSNPDGIMELFSKKSSISSNIDLTTEERSQRYSEEGLAYRIFDVTEKYIRTTRDSSNKKGLLLEKAGMEGDLSEINNTLYKQIDEYEDEIYDMEVKLYQKENAYYTKFAKVESLLSQMMSQSDFFTSMLGNQQ